MAAPGTQIVISEELVEWLERSQSRAVAKAREFGFQNILQNNYEIPSDEDPNADIGMDVKSTP